MLASRGGLAPGASGRIGSGVDGIRLRPGRPLMTPSARPWAGALLACCAILVVLLGALFAHQATASDWLDHAVDSPVIGWLGGHLGLKEWLAFPGSLIPAGLISAAIAVTCLLTGRLNGAVLAAAAVPAATGLDDGLVKHLVHRTYLGVLSYPSGHTTAVVTLAAVVALLLLGPSRPAGAAGLRAAVTAAAGALGVAVALGVIGMRWHYFTDTVAGAAVGIGVVCALALVLDRPAARRWLARACRQQAPGGPSPASRQQPSARRQARGWLAAPARTLPARWLPPPPEGEVAERRGTDGVDQHDYHGPDPLAAPNIAGRAALDVDERRHLEAGLSHRPGGDQSAAALAEIAPLSSIGHDVLRGPGS